MKENHVQLALLFRNSGRDVPCIIGSVLRKIMFCLHFCSEAVADVPCIIGALGILDVESKIKMKLAEICLQRS